MPKLTRIASALLALSSASLAPAGTLTWTGPQGGNWASATNWSGGVLPGASDDVQLGSFDTLLDGEHVIASLVGTGVLRLNHSGGRLTVNGAADLGALSLGLGTLTGNGSARVRGSLAWGDGNLAGAGSTLVQGQTSLTGSLFNTRSLTGGHTLTLAGGVQLNDNVGLDISGGSTLVNAGTWSDAATASVSLGSVDSSSGAPNRFVNSGSYEKSGTFVTRVQRGVAFDNTGSVTVDAGVLRLEGGGDTSIGRFSVNRGALDFNTIGHRFTLNGALVRVADGSTLRVSAGEVIAGDGLALAGVASVGPGSLALGAPSSFNTLMLNSPFALVSLSGLGATTVNTLVWDGGNISGGQELHIAQSAILFDSAGSTSHRMNNTLVLEAMSTNVVQGESVTLTGTSARIVNRGLWADDTTGGLTLDGLVSTFENAGGFLKARSGSSTVGWAFNNSGTLRVDAGELHLTGGGNSRAGSINVAQGALLEFGGSALHTVGRNLTNAGTLVVSSGVLDARDGLAVDGLTALRGNGALGLGADSRFAAMTLSDSALLSSSFASVIDGPMQWDGGGLAGVNGSTRINGTLTLAGPADKLVHDGHTLVLAGTTQLNEGRLRIRSAFNNQGVLNVASGAELFGDHASFANAGTLAGTGTVRALDALSNTGILAPGGVRQVGQLNLTGHLNTSGQLQVDLARSSADLLVVSGTATLGGTISFAVASGQRLARGSEFTVMSWGERTAGSEFATLDFSQAAGYRFATAYGTNGLSVTVTGLPFHWTGAASGGFWDVTQNWNDGSDGRPQAGDTILLGSANTVIRSPQLMQAATVTGTGLLTINSGGTLDLSESASLGGLNLNGSLKNAGRVVVVGGSTLSGGTLSGAGTTRYEGALNISGNSTALGSGHTLEVAGATTVRGNNLTGLSVNAGARVVNQGTWVEAASVDSRLSGNGGTSAFDNQGSFTKTTATTTTVGSFGLAFNNSGSVKLDAGTLSLIGGGASTGQIDIAGGATLDFAGSATFGLNRDVNNAGTFQIRGGIVNAPDGLVLGSNTVISGGRLNLSGNSQFDSFNFVGGGTLNNNGTLVVSGPTNWAGSTLTGSGNTRLEGPLSLASSSSITVSAGTLVLAGTTSQTGSGGINTNGAGARIINEGSWVEQANGALSMGGAGATHFDNPGSFSKTSTFTTTIGSFGLAFNNTGTVKVDAGTLALVGGGNSPGQFKVAAGSTLQFGGGTMALGKAVSNAGTVRVSNGIVNAAEGLVLGGSTVISGGTLNLGGSSQFERFDFVGGGSLNNSGSLVVTGPTTWGGSVFSGTGSTRLEGPLSLAGASSNTITSGTLVLAGTTTQTGTGNINSSGGRLVNEGVWLEQATGNTSLGGGGAASFENSGRFSKTSAFTTAIGTFGTAFKNTGTVEVMGGKLQVFSGFNNQGLLTIASGAELHGTSSAFSNAGTLAGDGTVRTADRLSNGGTLAAGGLNDAGTLSLLGSLTQQTGGIFLVDLGSTAAGGFDLLTISGAASLAGTLAVNLLDGAHFNVGDSFTVMTWNQRLNNSQFANLDLTQAGGYDFATEYGANGLTLRVTTAVPEPGSWALMAAGLLALGYRSRRKPKPKPTTTTTTTTTTTATTFTR